MITFPRPLLQHSRVPAQLQEYRLRNHAAVRDAISSVPDIPIDAREIASTLLASIVDEGFRARLKDLLKTHFQSRQMFSVANLALIEALLTLSHGIQHRSAESAP
jgi:hypothetical protein